MIESRDVVSKPSTIAERFYQTKRSSRQLNPRETLDHQPCILVPCPRWPISRARPQPATSPMRSSTKRRCFLPTAVFSSSSIKGEIGAGLGHPSMTQRQGMFAGLSGSSVLMRSTFSCTSRMEATSSLLIPRQAEHPAVVWKLPFHIPGSGSCHPGRF